MVQVRTSIMVEACVITPLPVRHVTVWVTAMHKRSMRRLGGGGLRMRAMRVGG